MSPDAESILANLEAVVAERFQRSEDPALARRIQAIKAFQHARFGRCYADLLATPRYVKATQFFLDDLYGPHDFTDRDAQFIRVVPALVRLFPSKVVQTVRILSELHALSEELDTQMGRAISEAPLDAASYQQAWRATGRPKDRSRQIELMIQIGTALERYTSSALLEHTLRLMRGPARAAGLSSLQTFLEAGFDAFKAMGGASEFLETIAEREQALSDRLFQREPIGVDAAALLQFPDR